MRKCYESKEYWAKLSKMRMKQGTFNISGEEKSVKLKLNAEIFGYYRKQQGT